MHAEPATSCHQVIQMHACWLSRNAHQLHECIRSHATAHIACQRRFKQCGATAHARQACNACAHAAASAHAHMRSARNNEHNQAHAAAAALLLPRFPPRFPPCPRRKRVYRQRAATEGSQLSTRRGRLALSVACTHSVLHSRNCQRTETVAQRAAHCWGAFAAHEDAQDRLPAPMLCASSRAAATPLRCHAARSSRGERGCSAAAASCCTRALARCMSRLQARTQPASACPGRLPLTSPTGLTCLAGLAAAPVQALSPAAGAHHSTSPIHG